MNKDYLWDGKGDPGDDIDALEEVLGSLKYDGTPLREPALQNRKPIGRILALAAGVAVTFAAGIWWSQSQYQTSLVAAPVPYTADGTEERTADPDLLYQTPPGEPGGVEIATLSADPIVREPEEKDDPATGTVQTENHEMPRMTVSSVVEPPGPRMSLDSGETQLFSPGDDMLEGEVNEHLGHAQLLLRSFKNVRSDGDAVRSDLDYERTRARELLDDNVLLRRDTHATGDIDTSELLNRLETYLLDIANMRSDQMEFEFVRERIEKRDIIAALQIHRQ